MGRYIDDINVNDDVALVVSLSLAQGVVAVIAGATKVHSIKAGNNNSTSGHSAELIAAMA